MDPITISLLVAGGSAAGAAVLAVLEHWRKSQPPPLPPPPPEQSSESPPQNNGAQPNRTPALTQAQRDEHAIVELMSHIVFTQKMIEVGRNKVGERVVGERLEECPWPADEISVRPLRDLSELPLRLSSETTAPPELQLLRAAAGEALVAVHEQRIFDTEPVYEPIYKRIRRAVYVLLDCSGSMFEGNGWKGRLAKSLVARMMYATVDGSTTFMNRWFSNTPGPLETVDTQEGARTYESLLMQFGDRGGTDIPVALKATIEDFKDDPLDEADVMIVTDGEQEFDTGPIRGQLTKNNIRLHAVLFGTNNAALRKMADVYYEVLPGPVVSPPVYRTPPKPRKKKT